MDALSQVDGPSSREMDDADTMYFESYPNDMSPIARLPPELLSAIFLAYATSVREDYTHSWREVQPYLWVQVTHVCRYWRDVALDCAVLWSWVVPVSEACTQAMLSRSRQAPLTVNLNTQLSYRTRPLPNPHVIDTIHQQWARIGQAQIELPNPALTNLVAPLLRALDVRSWCSNEDVMDTTPLFHPSCTPALRRISWFGGLSRNSFFPLLGPNVEELRVVPTFSAITVETWVSVLENMPQLRVLSLDGAVHSEPVRLLAFDPTAGPSVGLHHLQRLTLSATASILGEACLLSRLTVPADADISLSTYSMRAVTGDDARILARSVILATSGRRMDKLTLWRQDHTFFRPRTTLRWVISSSSTSSAAPTHASVSIELRVDYSEVDRTTIDISSELPISNVTCMHLALGDDDTEAFGVKALSAAFGKMERLEEVVAEGYAAMTFPEEHLAAQPLSITA